MSVLVVVIAGHIELRHLCTALTAHRLCLTVLLAHEGLDLQFTEFQIGLDTEQRLTASDEVRGQVHRHVTGLDGLNDIVLFALVVEVEVLLVKGERGFGVVTHVEIQLRTHLTLDARLDLLVEIEDVVISRA